MKKSEIQTDNFSVSTCLPVLCASTAHTAQGEPTTTWVARSHTARESLWPTNSGILVDIPRCFVSARLCFCTYWQTHCLRSASCRPHRRTAVIDHKSDWDFCPWNLNSSFSSLCPLLFLGICVAVNPRKRKRHHRTANLLQGKTISCCD